MTIGELLIKQGVIVTNINDFCEDIGDQYRLNEDRKAFLKR